MYATKYNPTAQYKPATQSPRSNQPLRTTQSLTTIKSVRTTQSMSTIQSVRATKSVTTIQSARGTQSVSTMQATYTTKPMPTTKSPKYIVVTGLGKRCVVVKSQVSTYQSLISYIRASFPGMYYRWHSKTVPLPIVIQTRDLPACKGYFVDIQPNVWATIIADIDNIQVLWGFRKIKLYMLYMLVTRRYHTAGFIEVSSVYVWYIYINQLPSNRSAYVMSVLIVGLSRVT
ncbi:hypothetical protein EV421DRAFT_1927689 [Armillaria borealis]|uniref:Uncharacterized protein n=1 Tax=Armillaria borealis TaxID=47425 RepID=A0AA39IX35_9AGAR|nr:hypothetical protein EV421DRAFT_1927689 [Armillaria borealis]